MNFLKTILPSLTIVVGLTCTNVCAFNESGDSSKPSVSSTTILSQVSFQDGQDIDSLSDSDRKAIAEIKTCLNEIVDDITANDHNSTQPEHKSYMITHLLKAGLNTLVANIHCGASLWLLNKAINNIAPAAASWQGPLSDLISSSWHLECASSSLSVIIPAVLSIWYFRAAKKHGSWALENLGDMLSI